MIDVVDDDDDDNNNNNNNNNNNSLFKIMNNITNRFPLSPHPSSCIDKSSGQKKIRICLIVKLYLYFPTYFVCCLTTLQTGKFCIASVIDGRMNEHGVLVEICGSIRKGAVSVLFFFHTFHTDWPGIEPNLQLFIN